jgi:phenylalanyl-tRNA synthetase beta chain
MKFTLKWLKDHLETEATAAEAVERLTMIGLELESLEDPAAKFAPFTVAYVKEARRHRNADRLSVCIVDTGTEEVQVVCGAPNARSGMKGVFAPAGSYIPGTDMVLKPGEIRGEVSNGMLVSEREMGLSDEHEGIIDLPEDAAVGTPFAAILGLDDPVIDIAITPNRGDCLGVRGVARDLAAAGLGKLKPFDAAPVPGAFDSPIKWVIDLPDDKKDACPYVAGRLFRNVKNGPSPAWMQRRLTAIGLRPISALVDITNFVTYDLGRPLHVFDAGKVKGDLTMRLARAGEEIPALDGETYKLDPEMVVIADANGPEGIGGVMGGEMTGCTAETTDVRFERGLDPQSAVWGAEVAARLILEICGGEASHVVSAGEVPAERRVIEYRPPRVAQLGGLEVPAEDQTRILVDLGFEVAGSGDKLRVTVPPWRNDVEGEACLVEEVLRIHGFDAIPQVASVREAALPHGVLTPAQRRVTFARTALAWRGLNEAVTFSFLSGELAALFGGTPDSLRLVNPISADLDVMRPSVLPNLAAAAARNADRGLDDAALFEIGPQYAGDRPEDQARVAAALRAGRAQARHWDAKARAVDAFDAKGDALAVLTACNAPVDNLQVTTDAPPWYHPGRSGVLRLGPNVLANFGELHPRVLRRLDLDGPVAACEVFLGAIPLPKAAKAGKLKPALELSPFHTVERDFAFVVDEGVAAEKLLRAAKGADKALITRVELFDVYTGKGIEEGKKSLAVSVTLQPTTRTLTDAEIEAVAAKIVAQVNKATGGVLRG